MNINFEKLSELPKKISDINKCLNGISEATMTLEECKSFWSKKFKENFNDNGDLEKKKPLNRERISGKAIESSDCDKLEKERPNVVQNKLDGCRREEEVAKDLEKQYPEKEGYQILRERELCDKDGNPVIDEKTGQKRRVDFVVVKDGKVVDMIEVTSKTAPKRDQLAKEYRIRDNGGNYVKDCNGNICRIPNSVVTRVERRD